MANCVRFRLEQVLNHRTRREDLVGQELARAMAAVAAHQERAVAAQDAVRSGLASLREGMAVPVGLDVLRAGHEELASARALAAHERTVVAQLEAVADKRRADVVQASQGREAPSQICRAHERDRVEGIRLEAPAMDELASRRAARGDGRRRVTWPTVGASPS